MSANTKIEWADHTFNPWEGCQKVGPGCDHCYAETRNARFAGGQAINWGPGAPRRRTSAKNWQLPIKWNAEAAAKGIRYRVFCASLADVFDNAVDPAWRDELFWLISQTPHLDWLLLTKRIGNAADMIASAMSTMNRCTVHIPPPNVWLGATIVNQEEANRDIPKLLAVPARVHFISNEPALDGLWIPNYLRPSCTRHPGALDADGKCEVCEGRGLWGIGEQLAEHEKAPTRKGLDWVICGGESGPGARPMHPDWARSLRDQCEAAGVPFLFKQWGEWVDADNGPEDDAPYEGKADCWAHIEGGHHDGAMGVDFFNTYPMYRVGKKTAGRILDGRTWDGVPST